MGDDPGRDVAGQLDEHYRVATRSRALLRDGNYGMKTDVGEHFRTFRGKGVSFLMSPLAGISGIRR
ncbi:MAG TPA: hypothetical protein VG247_17330 [Pseudonocardiaceae bacterium]|nr:hypothetical protein [Pseudonocardiaceae bacterium]